MKLNLLKLRISELGLTQSQVANYIGISRNSFNRKLSGKAELRVGEIIGLCEFLNIENPEQIFLNDIS